MSRKSYKKKYEELQTQLNVDAKIKDHIYHYIHIPFSWAGIGRFFTLLGSIGLAILNFMLILSVGNEKKVWEILSTSEPNEAYHSFSQLIILYPIIGQYLLIGLSFICLVALIKKGFNNLKSYDEDGLIYGLIFGLIVGLSNELKND